jgi:thiol-disulfide isomerase/thioredoxin
MKFFYIALTLLIVSHFSIAQTTCTLKGNFPQASKKELVLKAFTMLGDSLLSKTTADDFGKFEINYPSKYRGAALLEIKESKSVIVLLNQENFEIKWDNLEDFNSLSYKNSPENSAFFNGIAIAQKAEQLMSALKFIKPIYEADQPTSSKKIKWVAKEIAIQSNAFLDYLNSLSNNSYVRYYLKLRKLIQDMPTSASKYPEQIPLHEEQFNAIDFASNELIRSGLYRELLEGYFRLMESKGDLDIVYKSTNAGTDVILKSLEKQPQLKQEVAQYLFNFFEKRSLFQAAEHLAFAMLDSQNCEMDNKRKALFEQYRKMAVGKIADDIIFENATQPVLNLNSITTKYKLIVFGASWCGKCQEEIPKLKSYYQDWKSKYNLEIVFISLDSEKSKYNEFAKDFPWLSSSELKGWEAKAALDYCIFGTPTMYLLAIDNKIVLKPTSEKQVQAWLESK